MSVTNIRAALETTLASATPGIATAWQNAPFAPPSSGIPYQRATILLATPDNAERGPSYMEQGLFQVSLLWPLQFGPSAAESQADLLRATFRRGATFESLKDWSEYFFSWVRVIITKTPEVGAGTVDGDRFFIPVKIRFSAFIP